MAFADLDHVNLIIRDRTHLLALIESQNFYHVFFTDTLRKAIFRSRFREIFFICRLSAGNVYIPFKMLATVAELFIFNGVALTAELGIKLVGSSGGTQQVCLSSTGR